MLKRSRKRWNENGHCTETLLERALNLLTNLPTIRCLKLERKSTQRSLSSSIELRLKPFSSKSYECQHRYSWRISVFIQQVSPINFEICYREYKQNEFPVYSSLNPWKKRKKQKLGSSKTSIAGNVNSIIILLPSDVIVLQRLPAQIFWREDVIWPWISQWMQALYQENLK